MKNIQVTEKNVVVIPVKGKSMGLPNKNKILLNGCIDEILKSNPTLYVIGDDPQLLENTEKIYGNKLTTYLLPPIKPFEDVTHSLRLWKEAVDYDGKMALVQCTSPNLKSWWLDKCFELYEEDKIVATACEIKFKPTALYSKFGDLYLPFSSHAPSASMARQLLPHTVRINGAIEVFHTDCLKNQSFFEGKPLIPFLVSEEDSIDVDTIEDLKKVSTFKNRLSSL
jgi:CMP-N-acetylneuraminic acid synthetase